MTVKLLTIGKKTFFFSLAVLTGLLVTEAILLAHSIDSSTPAKHTLNLLIDIKTRARLVEKIQNKLFSIPEGKAELVSISSSDIRQKLNELNRGGVPAAYLMASRQLFVIDARGRVLSAADSLRHYDLPLISGKKLRICKNTLRLGGPHIQEALETLEIAKSNSVFYPQVSEICIQDKVGILLYLNWKGGLPVILGSGSVRNKMTNLIAYFSQLRGTQVFVAAEYLDLRFAGQIIVKTS